MVGLHSYDNGTKQTWRGWQWNRIADRIPKRSRQDAICVYLCGPDDVDRSWALKRGFQNHNLIAVDIDDDNVRKVRSSGGLAVQGHLADLIAMWPVEIAANVLLADFTCGLTRGATDLIGGLLFGSATARGTILSVNLLRGRDPSSNAFRNRIAFLAKTYGRDDAAWHAKHRGLHFVLDCLRTVCDGYQKHYLTWTSSECAKIVSDKMEFARRDFYSYRSGAQYFDSAIFKWPLSHTNDRSHERMATWKAIRDSVNEAGRSVRFDYQHYVAKLAALVASRNRLIRKAC